MRSLILFTLVLSFAMAARAAVPPPAGCAGGTVFEDRNGNGRPDTGEPGLAGVAISDGRMVERTDSDGRYRMSSSADRPVFLVKPAMHAVRSREDGLPDYWRGIGDGVGAEVDAAPRCRPFALAPFAASGVIDLRIGFGPKEPGERGSGNWLQRLIAAFRTQY